MTTNLVAQGLELMLVGMGTVFVFLTLLVFATLLMSSLVGQFQVADDDLEISADEVAAITVAIAKHRGDI